MSVGILRGLFLLRLSVSLGKIGDLGGHCVLYSSPAPERSPLSSEE